MPAPLNILLIILALPAIATLIYYSAVLYRVRSSTRSLPSLRDALEIPLPDPAPAIVVIVPAHNESANIPRLVRSVLAQTYPHCSLILALDRCTDDTQSRALEAARTNNQPDPRLEIITIDHCPDDWAGKVHAIHTAYTRSTRAQAADLLLFADADTTFDPDLLHAAAATLQHHKLDMLSLLPTLTTDQWFERFVQPATGFELIRRFPIDRLFRNEAAIRFANGQFMLFSHDSYRAIGTHHAVRHALLEDLAFARLIARNRKRHAILMSDDLFHCRMYDSYEQFRRGWKRIFTESARCRIPALLKQAWRLRAFALLLPLTTLAALILSIATLTTTDSPAIPLITMLLSTAALITASLAVTLIYRSQRAPLHLVPLYPLAAFLTASIISEAARDLARDVPTLWAGRSYNRKTTQKTTPNHSDDTTKS